MTYIISVTNPCWNIGTTKACFNVSKMYGIVEPHWVNPCSSRCLGQSKVDVVVLVVSCDNSLLYPINTTYLITPPPSSPPPYQPTLSTHPINSPYHSTPTHTLIPGITSLYRGAWPSVLRALPSYAASFWGYEATLSLLEKQQQRYLLTVPQQQPPQQQPPQQPPQRQKQPNYISSSKKLEKRRQHPPLRLCITHPIESTPSLSSLSLLPLSLSSSTSLLPSSHSKRKGTTWKISQNNEEWLLG